MVLLKIISLRTGWNHRFFDSAFGNYLSGWSFILSGRFHLDDRYRYKDFTLGRSGNGLPNTGLPIAVSRRINPTVIGDYRTVFI